MNKRRLAAFVALGEELHFGRAAARGHVTQSAMSQQLKQLEDELQVTLVNRTQRSVTLTRAGEAFLVEARKIIAGMDQATHLAREIGSGVSGRLIVGTTVPALFIALPEIIARYKKRLPGIEVAVRVMTSTEQEAALSAGEIDVGLCHPPVDNDALDCLALAHVPFDLVMSTSNPLARVRRLELADLAGQNFITFPRAIAPTIHDAIIAMCQAEGFSPKVIVEATPAQTIIGLAVCDVGIGWIASKRQQFAQPGAVYRPLVRGAPRLSIGAAYVRQASLHVPVERFLDVAREVAPQIH